MSAQKANADIPFVQDLSASLPTDSTQVLNHLKELWQYLSGSDIASGSDTLVRAQ